MAKVSGTPDQVRGDGNGKAGKTVYKFGFALLPTVDHVFEPDGTWRFVICAWRTNDAKNDMSHAEFVALCQRIVAHHEAQG